MGKDVGTLCFAEICAPLLKENTLTLTPAMPVTSKSRSRTKPSFQKAHGDSSQPLRTYSALLCAFCTSYLPIFCACSSFINLRLFSHLLFIIIIFVESFAFIFISLCCQATLAFRGSSCAPPPGFQKFDTTCADTHVRVLQNPS